MSRINYLTDGQTARFPEFVKKWSDVGLCTLPADRVKAEASLALAYQIAKLPVPRVVWCGSPLSQGLTRAIVFDRTKKKRDSVGASVGASVGDSVRASVGASVRASVGDSVRASVGASVWASVGASVWDSVRASVWASVGASVRASVRASVWASVRASVGASVWASVRASVRDSVGASVRDSVGASVWASVRASVRASVGDSGYGQHDASWIGFYDYLTLVCGLSKQTKPLAGLRGLTESAGWYLPHSGLCWISERHDRVRQDERMRLHSADGPAVHYPDGWSIYAWHGVRVPEQVIERPDTLTSEQILQEANAEVRRVMVERVGLDRFLTMAKAKVLHTDHDGKRVLHRIDMPDDEPIVAVQVKCPTTGQTYFLRVPPQIDRCDTAVAWTFNFEKVSEYAPQIET